MRAYIPITPMELQTLVETGSFHTAQGLIVDPQSSAGVEMDADDQEEQEFEVSWEAAVKSREMQADPHAMGFVLAVDLEPGQMGQVQGNNVGLLSDISWSQVQSLLLSESDEEELSWFGPQEIPTYLPQWLA